MKKILVAVDRDGLSDAVVPAVAALARDAEAHVMVLHVVDPHAAGSSWSDAAHMLSNVIVRLAKAGVEAEGQARGRGRADVAGQIAGAAEEFGADLIALGSHGRGDAEALLLGSVGHRLSRLTAVPLLVARPTPNADRVRAVRRVLVAIDGSPETDPAVELALEIARTHGSEVRLFHRLQSAVVEGGAYIETTEEANALLDHHARRLRAVGVTVSKAVADGFGSVAHRVADAAAAWDADLVVIGSRRLGDWSALIQGSTSHGVLAESDRPVLVAGRPANAAVRS